MENRELARLALAQSQVSAVVDPMPATNEAEWNKREARAKEISTAVDEASGSFIVNGLTQALVYCATDGKNNINGQTVATWVAQRLVTDIAQLTGTTLTATPQVGGFDEKLVTEVVNVLLNLGQQQQAQYRFLQEEALAYLAMLKLYAKANKSETIAANQRAARQRAAAAEQEKVDAH